MADFAIEIYKGLFGVDTAPEGMLSLESVFTCAYTRIRNGGPT